MSNKPHKPKPSDEESGTEKKSNPNEVLKYSGMAFQMAAIMGVGIFLGKKLDEYFANEKPLLMLLCLLIFGFAAFYFSLRDFIKK